MQAQEQIVKLYTSGMQQSEIAKHLGVSPAYVSQCLQSLKEEFRRNQASIIEEHVLRDTLQVTNLMDRVYHKIDVMEQREGKLSARYLESYAMLEQRKEQLLGLSHKERSADASSGTGVRVVYLCEDMTDIANREIIDDLRAWRQERDDIRDRMDGTLESMAETAVEDETKAFNRIVLNAETEEVEDNADQEEQHSE